jgi:hypothetical protein
MNEIADLERRLEAAVERSRKASAALAPKHKGGEWEEFRAAAEEELRLERQLAAAKGEEYAEPCCFPLLWDIGAPLPKLMVNEYRAFLAFLLREPDPNWDGSYVTIKSPSDEHPDPLGLVEFESCISAKLGTPNDEVHEGHPLNGRGLEPYTAQRVVNSRWLKELERINGVHRMYRAEMWQDLSHFIFWFHDSTFECVARSFKIETHRTSLRELLKLMVERLTS